MFAGGGEMLSEGKMRASDRFTEITNQNGLYNIQAIDNVPSIMQRGLLSSFRAWTSHCNGFSCGAQAPGCMGLVVAAHRH